jgi:hypothetical protein
MDDNEKTASDMGAPQQEHPELTDSQKHMLQMLGHIRHQVLYGGAEAVSFTLCLPQRVPQHGFIASPGTASTLLAGITMAQAEMTDFLRSVDKPAPVDDVPEQVN